MTDLAELRQHVKSVGEHFVDTAEEDRKRSERVSRLLGVVEESFARSQQEIERSNEDLACANEDLACANDEVQQLRTMVQALLAESEDTGARGTSGAMRDLEDQANRLLEAASSISGTVSSSAPEMTKDSPATVKTGEDDRTAAGPEIDTEPVIEPSEEVSEKASLELTQMVTEDGAVVKLNTNQGHPTENDRTTLQKIIKRVSLQTGTLGEEQEQANTISNRQRCVLSASDSAMMFEEIKKMIMLAPPLDPKDPFAGLSLPSKEHLDQARRGRNIGHQYHTVACHLIEVAACQQKRRQLRRLAAIVNRQNPGKKRGKHRPANPDLTDIGKKSIDALVRLDEAVWSAHGRYLTFSDRDPQWHDEAVLAQYFAPPRPICEVGEIGAKVMSPLTGTEFIWPLQRVLVLEMQARALVAKERYKDLPLTKQAREILRAKAVGLLQCNAEDYKALHMLLWADFADSLCCNHYELEYHPTWDQYSEGRLAQQSLRRTYTNAAVDELTELLVGSGCIPIGFVHLAPWDTNWDQTGALRSGNPFGRQDWTEYERKSLRDAS